MTFSLDSKPEPPAQPSCGHDELRAEDLVCGAKLSEHPTDDECVEWLFARISELEREARAVRRAKPRTPSLTTRVKAVKRAGLEAVIKPDGSILTRAAAEGEQANGEANYWDRVLSCK